MNEKTKTVVCLSGGLDSSVLLAKIVEQSKRENFGVIALSVFYGQKHKRELSSARAIVGHLNTWKAAGIEHYELDLSNLQMILDGSALTSDAEVPEGHYSDENQKATIVPNRNMILLSLATALAVNKNASVVAYAAHAGDFAVYPDCRPEFISKMRSAMFSADYKQILLYTPFENVLKANVVLLGATLELPLEATWSCYKGGEIHCGRCATCVERLEAFSIANVEDLTEYEDKEFWKTVVERNLQIGKI